jgi:hypothetical protein
MYFNLNMVRRGDIAVMSVVHHSVGRVICRPINAYIVGSGGFVAICVIRHSFTVVG